MMVLVPRVISEIKKNNNVNSIQGKPRIAGELEWLVDGSWQLRHMEVRDGCLLVYNSCTGLDLRLPLRHLSLQPSNTPRTLSLVKDRQPVATLQAGSDEQYERWVKTLVVEVMRQTPLEAVRFLDILGITATIVSARNHQPYEDIGSMRRGASETNLTEAKDGSLRNSSEHRDRFLRNSYEDYDISLRNSYEDFDKSLRNSSEDYDISLRNSSEDYDISLRNSSEDCDKSLRNSSEDYDISLRNSSEDCDRSLRSGKSLRNSSEDCDRSLRSGKSLRNSSEDCDRSLRNSAEDFVISAELETPRGRPKERLRRTCLKNRKSEEDCEMKEDNVPELCSSKRGRAKERKYRVKVKNCVSVDPIVCEDRVKRPVRAQSSDPVRKVSDSESELEEEVAALLLKCQQVDNYVPVKEKKRLFESLCRRGRRLAQSSDNLCTVGVSEVKLKRKKRARSLHDLSRVSKSSVAVRDICRYFEQRGEGKREEVPRHKPPSGDRSTGGCNAYLSRRRVQRAERRLARYKQQAIDCEETIWKIQEEMATLDSQRTTSHRSRELRLYAALEMRLAEEEARLSRINEEAARTLREIELATDKFETAIMQSTEELAAKNSGRQ